MRFRYGFKWGALVVLALTTVVTLVAQNLGGIPAALNVAIDGDTAFKQGGTLAPNASPGFGQSIEYTLNAQEAGQELALSNVAGTLVEYVTGAAPDYFAALRVLAPTITAGAATDPTEGAALFIGAPGTGATNNGSIYFAGNATLRIEGTTDDGNELQLTFPDVTADVSGIVAFAQGATYARYATGTVTLDGANPTPVTTGLAGIVSCALTSNRSVAPALDPTAFTATFAVAGTLNVYAWKPTAAGDATLIASTDADDVVAWACWGT